MEYQRRIEQQRAAAAEKRAAEKRLKREREEAAAAYQTTDDTRIKQSDHKIHHQIQSETKKLASTSYTGLVARKRQRIGKVPIFALTFLQ
jgi:hypothetical protein